MSSVPLDPVPPSPAHNLTQNPEGNNHTIQQPEAAKPPPPSLQEPSSMECLSIPPFWETTRDGDLTIALISAQRSERRAESRLIRRRLKRIKVEQELYSHMEKRTAHRLSKADVGVGVTRGVLRLFDLAPARGAFEHCLKSDSSTRWDGSDVEA